MGSLIAGYKSAGTKRINRSRGTPGAGDVKAADCRLETARVAISDAGDATLRVTGGLTGEISGAGNLEYYGTPKTDTKVTGLGRFKSTGKK